MTRLVPIAFVSLIACGAATTPPAATTPAAAPPAITPPAAAPPAAAPPAAAPPVATPPAATPAHDTAAGAPAPSPAGGTTGSPGAAGQPGTESSDRGAAAAGPPVACSTDANPASVLPRTFDLGTADLVCDVKDRVIVVSAKQVTVRTRPLLTPVRAPIERTGHLGDRCDGPGGGHAGCSITYWRFSSKVLGSGHLEFGNNAGNVLHDDDPDKAMDCREYSSFEVIATCSTATSTARRRAAIAGCSGFRRRTARSRFASRGVPARPRWRSAASASAVPCFGCRRAAVLLESIARVSSERGRGSPRWTGPQAGGGSDVE